MKKGIMCRGLEGRAERNNASRTSFVPAENLISLKQISVLSSVIIKWRYLSTSNIGKQNSEGTNQISVVISIFKLFQRWAGFVRVKTVSASVISCCDWKVSALAPSGLLLITLALNVVCGGDRWVGGASSKFLLLQPLQRVWFQSLLAIVTLKTDFSKHLRIKIIRKMKMQGNQAQVLNMLQVSESVAIANAEEGLGRSFQKRSQWCYCQAGSRLWCTCLTVF